MIVTVEGEQLDGFHIEHVPQINRDDQFDKAALSSIAGMRAVWLLYWLGRWEHLEDLGVNRTLVEPVLVQCCSGFGEKLTHRQARQLQSVPAMVEASRELRLAYALKNLDNQGKGYSTMEQTIYHAEVPTVEEAKVVVQAHGPEIEAAGGTIEYGSSKGAGSIVMVKLPASQIGRASCRERVYI